MHCSRSPGGSALGGCLVLGGLLLRGGGGGAWSRGRGSAPGVEPCPGGTAPGCALPTC